MASWMMSIVGIVCLGVLLDLIMPEGQTSKYIKGIFSLLVIFVIVSPLPKLFGEGIDFKIPESTIQLNQEYLQDISDLKLVYKENSVDSLLKKSGFDSNTKIKYENSDLSKIQSVCVTLSNKVIDEKDKNIHTSSVKLLVGKFLNVSEQKVAVEWFDG